MKKISSEVRKLAEQSSKYFRNPLAQFIYYRSYSRWIDSESRRETWIETVQRYIDFMRENLGKKLSEVEYTEIQNAILNHEVMPSMRLLWGAGKTVESNNATAYNCSYIAPVKLEDLSEIMFLSMSGCGVGFSVESQTAQEFPLIKKQRGKRLPIHIVGDSREGWCDALTVGLKAWYPGADIDFDYSEVRPLGSRLVTMGGTSSGPAPLKFLLEFAKRKILSRQGKRLTNLDLHDIICKIGEIVVVGGVRRTALISLSDLDDEQMRDAKQGQFYIKEPQRAMANNSAVYTEEPSSTQFLSEWIALAKSGSGERGIFNRGALEYQLPERRMKLMGDHMETVGTNPCGEIILRSKQFCNLSEVVCRETDTKEILLNKVRIATAIGTYQSMFTDFKYLSREWKRNCEEERLLGVSLTGIWDCPAVHSIETLQLLREKAIEINKEYSKRFGISSSTAITCVKPSGTVSQLVDSSSGMHPRHAPYYIRRIRIASTDPLFKMLKDQGVPYKPEVGQLMDTASTYVLEFPVKSPDNAIFRNSLTALEQLEHWKDVKVHYCEHNPSVTISVGESEWILVANWVFENWSIVGGLSFLPRDENVYELAPYETITEEQYESMTEKLPWGNFSNILLYENEDTTQGSKEMACVGGICEWTPNG